MKGKVAWGIAGLELLAGLGLGIWGIISVDASALQAETANASNSVITKQEALQVEAIRDHEIAKVQEVKDRILNLRSLNMIGDYRGGADFVSSWNRQWRVALESRIEKLTEGPTRFLNVDAANRPIESDPTVPKALDGVNGNLSRPNTPYTQKLGPIDAGLGKMAVSAIDTFVLACEKGKAKYLESYPLFGNPDISAFHSAFAIANFNFDSFEINGPEAIYGLDDPYFRRTIEVELWMNPRMVSFIMASMHNTIEESGMAMDLGGVVLEPLQVPVGMYVRKELESDSEPDLKTNYPDTIPDNVYTDPDAFERWRDDPEGWARVWETIYLNPEEHEELSVKLTLKYYLLDANKSSPLLKSPDANE